MSPKICESHHDKDCMSVRGWGDGPCNCDADKDLCYTAADLAAAEAAAYKRGLLRGAEIADDEDDKIIIGYAAEDEPITTCYRCSRATGKAIREEAEKP